MARRIFHIDLDAFFVSVEQMFNSKLKEKSVIVGGDPERRGIVDSPAYEARPFDIHAGMLLYTCRRKDAQLRSHKPLESSIRDSLINILFSAIS